MFSPFVEHAPVLAMIAVLALVAFARRRRRIPWRPSWAIGAEAIEPWKAGSTLAAHDGSHL